MRTKYFFTQILQAIPKSRKNDLLILKNLVFQDYHLIRKHHMYFLNKSSSKEIYNFLISLPQKNKKLHQDYILS